MNRIAFIFIMLLASVFATAQVMPTDGSVLTYRIIGFSFPVHAGASTYTVEIAAGNYTNEEFFEKNIIATLSSKTNRVIADVPAFGAPYTWRVISTSGKDPVTRSSMHHFSTAVSAVVDTDSTRLRILIPPARYKDSYVFVDANKTLYDMTGRPVWYLPEVDSLPGRYITPRDLKRSCANTITFMSGEQTYEIDYRGNLLWHEPEHVDLTMKRAEKINSLFHHEFTRMQNGHYMALGTEQLLWEITGVVDTSKVRFKTNMTTDSTGKRQQKVIAGRIIEFDKDHKEVWSWSSLDYFKTSDIYYRHRPNGLFQVGNTHQNAFYFDERSKIIYTSFRNLNRVLKISYPTGHVLNTYGMPYEPGDREMHNDLFCGQHGCRRSMDGYLYLYNNNSCNRLCDQLPTVLIMQEPAKGKGGLKKIWEYECKLDELSKEEKDVQRFETGGNVLELPDRSLLVCMAGSYGKLFIITRDKQIIWSALPEYWNIPEQKWKPGSGYRASIITRQELESLIWNEPLKKK